MNGISVVVCCYNSERRLGPTLLHLSRLTIKDEFKCEIILIDNASTDNTAKFSEVYWQNLKCATPFKIIKEDKPGLSFARTRGVMESAFDLILFCDDDNWLDENYLINACSRMNADSTIGVLGGQGIPEFEDAYPEWVRKHKRAYAVGPNRPAPGYLTGKGFIYGAGMVIRKQVLKQLYLDGITSLLSDRKGTDLVSGGDTEICLWFKYMGYQLYYDEQLTFIHFIPKERLTEAYLIRRSAGKGKTEAVLQLYKDYMAASESIEWIQNKIIYYTNILKRFVLWLFIKIKPFPGLHHKLEASMLLATIKFRLNNYNYLVESSRHLKNYLEIMDRYRVKK